MVQRKNAERQVHSVNAEPGDYSGDAVLSAGLSLILAEAARSHLKAGDVKTASVCLAEAERFMSLLPESSQAGASS